MLWFVTLPSIPASEHILPNLVSSSYVLTNWNTAIPWFVRIIRYTFKWSNENNVLLEGFLWQLTKVQVQNIHRTCSVHQLEDMRTMGQLCLQCAAFYYCSLKQAPCMYTYLSGLACLLICEILTCLISTPPRRLNIFPTT